MIDHTEVAAIIRALRIAAANEQSQFFLVGAFARDLRLVGVGALQKLRQTKDVDFAVMVPDLETFLRIRGHLLRNWETRGKSIT